MKTWCEHITLMHNKTWIYDSSALNPLKGDVVPNQVNFCPICGAKRPEGERLKDKLFEACHGSNYIAKACADICIDEVLRIADEVMLHERKVSMHNPTPAIMSFKQRMIEFR